MDRTPARYTLNEGDIKEAISEWLYNNHDVEIQPSDVKLCVERQQKEPSTPYRGGMSDWVDVEVFSATAEETD